MEIYLSENSRGFEADSGKETILEYTNPYWICDMTFSGIGDAEARELDAMLGELRGRVGTVAVPRWKRRRLDAELGTITLVTAAKDAYAITVEALSAVSQVIFRKGDYISFSNEMFLVTRDAITNGSGIATVQLNKRLRNTYSAGTEVEYKNPVCIMRRMNADDPFSERPKASSISLSFREDIA
jgi:hypothetical protein